MITLDMSKYDLENKTDPSKDGNTQKQTNKKLRQESLLWWGQEFVPSTWLNMEALCKSCFELCTHLSFNTALSIGNPHPVSKRWISKLWKHLSVSYLGQISPPQQHLLPTTRVLWIPPCLPRGGMNNCMAGESLRYGCLLKRENR